MQCPRFISNVLTETDNKTFCPIRIIATIGCVQYLGLTLAHYIQHTVWDPQAFAIGLGALVGGTGVALGLKKDSQKE